MLHRDQIELIHREIDGANTPDESAAFRSLIQENPEARALAAELRQVTAHFEQWEEREPPPHLKRAILDALPQPARASPHPIVRWTVSQLTLVTALMEELIMTRKALLIGSTAVAVVIFVAALVTGFPPGGGEAGTIGAGDSIAGVRQAARYRGRAMTQADVTLANPEIQALFQNDQVLNLVKSDVFREMMQNEAYRQVMSSEVYRQMMENEAFRQLQEQGAFRQAQSSEAMRALQENEAFRQLQSNDAFRLLAANEAFRQLQESEAFRALSRSQQLSEAFMNEAMRAQK